MGYSRSRSSYSDPEHPLNAARRGLGLAWLFRACIEEDLAAGTLETVLDDYGLERPGHFLYFPRANTRIRAFRAFVDFMKLRAG